MSPNNFPGKMCDVLRWHCTNISKGKIAVIAGVYQEGLGVILGVFFLLPRWVMCCFWRLMSLMSQQERLPYFDPSREEVEKLVEACKANDGLSMGLPWFSLNGHAAFEFSVQDGLGGLRLAHLPKLSGWVTSGQFGCRIWLLSFLMMLFVLSVVVPSGFSRVFLRCY